MPDPDKMEARGEAMVRRGRIYAEMSGPSDRKVKKKLAAGVRKRKLQAGKRAAYNLVQGTMLKNRAKRARKK